MNPFDNQPTNGLLGAIARALAEPSLEDRKRAAWAATTPINSAFASLYPPDAAVDELGNIICFSKHGDHNSPYGWDIDHRVPTALGGSNALNNLRALRCSANRALGGILGGLLKG